MKDNTNLSRRRFLQLAVLAACGLHGPKNTWAGAGPLITKSIPSSRELIPVIGLGSSRTFNVGDDPAALANVAEVIRNFLAAGGKLIDSSPMYGSSQPAIGYALKKLVKTKGVFSADKVWTWDADRGLDQIEKSRSYWNVDDFDLMQVHNLVEWEQHLKTLFNMKRQGKIRYVGITTSHGRRLDELEDIMKVHPLDFVQFSYNMRERETERRLLPLARKRGIAVIANRPFQRGELIDDLKGKPLPAWAKDINCKTWPQFLLKFVVSHPAVTCAIPATSQVDHVRENMVAALSGLPDNQMRERMLDYVEKIL